MPIGPHIAIPGQGGRVLFHPTRPPPPRPRMNQSPRIHLIVVLYNSEAWVEVCLRAAMAQTLAPWRITVFDNGSVDGGALMVEKKFPDALLLRSPRNLGYAAACNRAAQAVRNADLIVLLNPDAIMALTTMERLATSFKVRPDIGILGCKLLEPDVETIQHVGGIIEGNALTRNAGAGETDNGQYKGIRPAVTISGAVLAIRQDVWCELGGFDEGFWPAYYEETDFCLRARAAHWGVAVDCDATATHFHASEERWHDARFLELYFAGRARFLLKHYRPKDWLLSYLPAELKWLRYWGSRGMRRMALRTIWQGRRKRRKERADARAAARAAAGQPVAW